MRRSPRQKPRPLKLSPFVTEVQKVDLNKITKGASAIKIKLLDKTTEAQGRTELGEVLKQLYTDAELGDLSKKSSEDPYDLLLDKMEQARDDEAVRKQLMKALNLAQ